MGSGGDLVLARTSSRPLARNDDPLHEELAAPDAPGLAPLERTREALLECRAGPAERLRELDVRRALGEPELRVVLTAGHGLADGLRVGAQVDELGQAERGHLRRHLVRHLPSVLPLRSGVT